MSRFYVPAEDRYADPIELDDPIEWARMISHGHHIGVTTVERTSVRGYTVSTLFVGVDLSHGASPRPMVYQTMLVRGSWVHAQMWLWSSWSSAEAGHERVVLAVLTGADLEAVS